MEYKNIELSTATDNVRLGKHVKFYCTNSDAYVVEKHTLDHEQFGREQDANLLRHLLRKFLRDTTPLIEKGELKSPNLMNAIDLLILCSKGLTDNASLSGTSLERLKPYSAEMLHTVAGYMCLALSEVDVTVCPSASLATEKLYKQLKHLAYMAENRYEIVLYPKG